ncbi:MAG: class I SAM-dependent DNA methyltransferase [Anaerolineales bacterium]|nr:class I SAM-dependent DNA methyltransferase [Anaerolineales bacterium]
MTPQEFVHKWRTVQLKERSFYQEHFLDICALVGHPTPAGADKTGAAFSFEAATRSTGSATRSTGSKTSGGFADVWKRGFFAWEYKGGQHADLDKAYDQLLRYRESLENPVLLVVSDAHTIRIHTNFSNSVKRIYELTLDDLLLPEKLAILRAVFHDPAQLKAPETPEQVTEQAAREFSRLAEILRKWGEAPAPTAHFLIRLLFCLFAEDVGLLPKALFTRLVARTRRDARAFAAQLGQLFAAMATGGWFGEHPIYHFNGGLFDDAFALELASDGLDILNGLTGLDWSSIEPSILGTLFERSLDPTKRAQLGAHYTSRDDILLIVEPVLMAPLQRKWETVEATARGLSARAAASEHLPTRARYTADLARLLQDFADELRAVRILDPACGSGNFLYVSLRQMLDLWKGVSNLAGELGLPMMMAISAPSPAQLYGIEINEYAHELAQATIWIGYIQWLRENGYGLPPEPVLRKLDNIHRMDAILAFDAEGKPVEPEWPVADVVVGNPPFLGGKWLRNELGDKYVDNLFVLWDGKVPHQADLVCYWFEKTQQQIAKGVFKRAGLLATQQIRSGQNRIVLDHILGMGKIFMAWSDREWVLDGADVRVSMIGFDNGSEQHIQLDGTDVSVIYSNLTSGVDTTKAVSLPENVGICLRTDEKGGDFDISEELAKKILSAPINVNGRPNSDVVIPWMSGIDIVQMPRNKWIIDFGIDMSLEEASQYEMPFRYVEENVKPERMKNRIGRLADKWWIHRGPGLSMRKAREKLQKYIVIPRVAKHPIFVFLDQKYLPDVRLVFFAREDDYFFGLLQSKVHVLWHLENGTRHGIGNDPTYIPTTTFETFPFPWPPGQEPQDDPRVQAIASAARELNEKRERWLKPDGVGEAELKKRTLTNLYNARPTWLALAHEKLDRAVLDAYGWPHDLGEDEILGRLLEENLRRSG